MSSIPPADRVIRVRLSDLHFVPELQTRRDGLCRKTVADYLERYRNGERPANPVVYLITDRDYPGPVPAIGFHRLEMYRQDGVAEIEVDQRTGTFREAWLASYLSNRTHGLPYSPDDKRHVIGQALALFAGETDTAIAKRLRLSQQYVSKVRGELEAAGRVEPRASIIGSDGVQRSKPKRPDEPSQNSSRRDRQHVGASPGNPPPSPSPTSPAKPKPVAAQEPIKDASGQIVPTNLRDLFAPSPLPRIAADLRQLAIAVRGASQVFERMLIPEAYEHIETAARQVEDAIPYRVCPECKGAGRFADGKGCCKCHTRGYLIKPDVDDAELREQVYGKKGGAA